MRTFRDSSSATRHPALAWTALIVFLAGACWTASSSLFPPEQLKRQLEISRSLEADDGDAESLIADFQQAFPKNPVGMVFAAELAARKFDHERSLELFSQLPDDNGALQLARELGVARRLQVLGRTDEQEAALRKALQLDEKNREANSRLGHLLHVQGRTWESLPYFMTLIRNGVCRGDELIAVATTERYFRADDDIEFAVNRAGAVQPAMKIGQARRLLFENKHQEATELFRQIVQQVPSLGEAQGRLGRLYVENGTFADVRNWDQSLWTANIQHPEIWFARGLQARRHGKIDGAAFCFLQAILLSPNHLPANTQMTSCLEQLGKSDAARYFGNRTVLLSELDIQLNILRGNVDEQLMLKVALLQADLHRYWEAAGWIHVLSSISVVPDSVQTQARKWRQLALQDPSQNYGFQQEVLALDLGTLRPPLWNDVEAESLTKTPAGRSADQSAQVWKDLAHESGLRFRYFEGTKEENRLQHIFNVVGGGVGALDFDRDDCPDLYFAQACDWRNPEQQSESDRLFRNIRATGFHDVTEVSNVREFSFSHGVSTGDFDCDGFTDVYVCNLGANRLYRNLGDGTFEEVSAATGVDGSNWSISAAFADFNNDGLSDLFVGNYTLPQETASKICTRSDGKEMACTPDVLPAASDQVYLNRGDGTFLEITDASGVFEQSGRALGLIAWDFFGEGRTSIFVANDTSANFLYHNVRNTTAGELSQPQFQEEGILQGVAYDLDGNAQASMGVAAGDVNHDGLIDMFITNFANESNTLYVQNPDRTFLDQTRQFRLRDSGFSALGFGTQMLDANFDNWPDIVITNGHVDQSESEPNADRMQPQLLINQNGEEFSEVVFSEEDSFFKRRTLGRGVATLDWNADGRQDFVVSHLHDDAALVTSLTPRNMEARSIRLVSRTANRDGQGAQVTIRSQEREWHYLLPGGFGYLCSNMPVIFHYQPAGEGSSEVTVRWPDGQTEHWTAQLSATNIILQGVDRIFTE